MTARRKSEIDCMFAHKMYTVDIVNKGSEQTLMNELIKCMLSISARLSPYNGTSWVVDMRTTASHGLAIRLHVTLPKDMRTKLSPYT